jgi:uncharacterized membrane protein YdjX (TVP38/TMEM64 family)
MSQKTDTPSSLSAPKLEVHQGLWKWLCLVGMVAAAILVVTVWREPLNRGLELLRQMGPVPFYGVVALCLSFGVPAAPFLLVCGATFSFWTNLAGWTVAFAVSLAFTYFFANRLFKAQLDQFLQKKAGSLNHLIRQNTVAAVVLARLTPGFPYMLQNCFLAPICPSFTVFMFASLPPLICVAMLYTSIGGGLVHTNVTLLVLPAAVLVLMLLAVRHFIRKRK